MKILITGGAGYIGSHVVKLFLGKGYDIVVFDNLSRGYKEPMDILTEYGNLEFISGDLRKKEEISPLFNNHKFDGVIHLAALCSVNESFIRPELYFKNNITVSDCSKDIWGDSGETIKQ